MDNIKACPFCGGEAEKHKHMDRCACDRDTCWLYGRFMSIDDWNTRTPDLAKMVEDMRVAKEALEEIAYGNLTITEADCADVAKQAITRLKPYDKLFEKEGDE